MSLTSGFVLAATLTLVWISGPSAARAQNAEAPPSFEAINEHRIAERQAYAERKMALEKLPPGSQRDLQLKQEIQRHLAENKRLSLQEQALRRDLVSDLKQKWKNVETDWQGECARHDAARKQLENLPEGPERTAKINAENASHRARSQQIAVERNVIHERVVQQANREVAGGSTNVSNKVKQTAGTKITDPNFRGMNSDFDVGGGYRTTEKTAKILNEIGVKSPSGGKVTVKGGVLETAPEFGMTVNAEVGLDRIGSAGHQTQVKVAAAHGETYVSELGGAVKSPTLKDHLATLDHTKKAMHGLNEPPGKLVGGAPEGQAMAKGALKAADQAKLPPETVELIARKFGIKNPETILDQLAEIKAGRSTISSAKEAAKLQGAARDILKASEGVTRAKADAEILKTESQIADLKSKGKLGEANSLRQELADYKAKSKAASGEVGITERSVTKSAPGGKSPSQPKLAVEPAVKSGSVAPAEPELKPTAGSKLIQGAGLLLGLYGIYEGYFTAREELDAIKEGEPKDWIGWTSGKAQLAVGTLWHGLGFGGMAEVGEKAGEESFKQYKKDIADGKVSPDSSISYGWMKARAVLNGLYGGAKAMTYDAIKHTGEQLGTAVFEGEEAAKGVSDMTKANQTEQQRTEETAKKVYDKLIKDGASPVGAKLASDRVLRGDFTEAKRLNQVMKSKRAAKLAAAEKEEATRNRTWREKKKLAARKQAVRKEELAREGATDEEVRLRELVIARLQAKDLPTGSSLVDRLVDIIQDDGMPAFESALSEMTSMQGGFTGMGGNLRITVKGNQVTGGFNETFRSGDVVSTTSCTLKGEVDLNSGIIWMNLKGTNVCDGATTQYASSFSGTFTGKGFKGRTTESNGSHVSWSVSR